jgi:hypothetical protein
MIHLMNLNSHYNMVSIDVVFLKQKYINNQLNHLQ